MQKSRVCYLDVYKGIGIILVVLGHMETTPDLLKLWLNAFHMPLFFVAAGLLIGENRLYERESKSILRDRARSILIPYFWFSLIDILWYGMKALLAPAQHSQVEMVDLMWDSLSFFGVSVLWFLPAFFVGVTGYQFLRKKVVYLAALPILATLAVGTCVLWGWPEGSPGEMSEGVFLLKLACVVLRGCAGMFFCALGEGMGILIRHLADKRGVMLLAGLGLTGIGTYFALTNVSVSFCYLIFGNRGLFWGAAICLNAGILLLCRSIGHLALLEYPGRHSMIIMVTHLDLQVLNIAQKAGNRVLETADHPLIYNIVVSVVIIVLELFWIWLLDGCFGFMIGKGRKKESHLDGL